METGQTPTSTDQKQPPTSLKKGVVAFIRDCCYGDCDVMLGSFCVKRSYVNELWRIFKYGVVGSASTFIHVGSYHLMSRVVWESGSRTLQYVIALTASAIFNFTLHHLWTFAVSTFQYRMIVRYVGVVGASMAMQSSIFYLFVDVLHWYDYIVFVMAFVISVGFQYFLHRIFTFKEEAVVRS